MSHFVAWLKIDAPGWRAKIRWALLISALALFLRAYLAYSGGVEWDEPVYVRSASEYAQALQSGDWNAFLNPTYNTEHPQFNKLIYGIGLLPFNPIATLAPVRFPVPLTSIPFWPKLLALRMISVLFGVLAVFVLSLIHPWAGLFLAVDTFAIKYSSVIYLEALPVFAALISFLTAQKALNGYQNRVTRREKGWMGWLLLSAVTMGMALASKYMYAAVALTIPLVVMVRAQGWKQKIPVLAGIAAWGALSLLFFLLCDPVLWSAPFERLQQSAQFSFEYANSKKVVVESAYPVWQPLYWLLFSIPQHAARLDPYSTRAIPFAMGPVDYFVLADSLIFILAVIGLPVFYKRNLPMFLWLLVGLAFLLLWQTKWPQYVMLVLPVVCLSAGYGLDWLLSWFRKTPA